jgi:general secretion pathway protein D
MTSFLLKRQYRLGFLALAVAWLMTNQALAQMPTLPPGPAGVVRTAPAKADTNRTVELKFSAAPLDTVLQYYCSELTGRTLLQAPAINATITLRSQSVLTIPEAIQAIKTILAMNNITLINQGDKFVKAVPIASAPTEGLSIQSNQTEQASYPETDDLVSEVIPLKHIDPAEAQKAIQGLIHAYGKILPLERINSLLVADAAININRIKEVLTRIDQPLDIKESIHIILMRNSKASEVKTKLEEIIADQKEKEKTPTVRRMKDSGSPGVDITPAIPTIPGVIRARPTVPSGTTTATTSTTESEPEDGRMIRGNVKVIADDRTGSLIIITRPENMPFFRQVVEALDVATAPDVAVEVIRLEYADAEEVASMLNALIGAASTPTTKTSTPKRTTTTGSTTPGQASGTTASKPAEEPRSFQLQEFIEQQRALSSGKGAEGKSKIGQLSAENIKILADKRSNAVIMMASKNDMLTMKDLLKSMDVMLSQVLIEAVIMQVSLDKSLERGVDWVQRSMIAYNKENYGRDGQFAFAGAGGGGKSTPLNATTLNSAASLAGGGGLTYYFTQFGLNIDAVIKMSATDNRSKILASPVILTTDNKEAKIDVSEERYFYKGVSYTGYTGTTGATAVPNVEARKVGLSLTVTPRINAKKFVVMEIAQKIENVAGSQTISDGTPGGANEWPIVASREMTASVSVRSGETIILGGLVENNTSQDVSMIPWLGKIPILGIPFRSSTDKNKRAEIVVFITPYVLDSPEEIEAEAARRKGALSSSSDGLWEKGWSDSKLADPPRSRAGQAWRNLLK